MKSTKRNIVISAILSLALCVSLIAGATFAIFTSESKVNIAVTSGKVDVVATIDETSAQTKQLYDEDYTGGKDHMYQGEVEFTEDGLSLKKLLPGDGIKFNIVIENKSNVTVKYRTVVGCADNTGLFEGLAFNVNGAEYDGSTKISAYEVIEIGSNVVTVPIAIELPEAAGNEYRNTSCSVYFKVEAIQANAATEDVSSDVLTIYTAQDLRNFAKNVNDGTLGNYSEIKLMNDIDLENKAFTPIGVEGHVFGGVFNGNGKTIKNLNVKGERYVGLFGATTGCLVKDLTVDGAKADGINHVAVIIGHALCSKVERCIVKNAEIVTKVKNNDDGDKAASIVGYLSAEPSAWVKDCVAENIKVSGYRDIGGIVGYANSAAIVTGNKVKDLKLVLDNSVDYKNYASLEEHDINAIIGEYNNGTVDSSNTYENFSMSFAEGSTVNLSDKTKIAEGTVIAGEGIDKTGITARKVSLDNNVTVKDMTIKCDAPEGNEGAIKMTGTNTTMENVQVNGQGFNGDTKAISVTGSNVLIRNSKISGAFRGIIFWDDIGGDNVIENCIIDNVIYTFNINASKVKPGTTLTVKGSTLNGWTSYAGCMEKVTFIDCKLGKSNGYAYMAAYADTEIKNCEFYDGYRFGAGATGKTFTFTNCKIDGVKITAGNFAEIFGDVDATLKGCTVVVDGVTVQWN